MRLAFFTTIACLLGIVAAAALGLTVTTMVNAIQSMDSEDASTAMTAGLIMAGVQFALASLAGTLAGKAWQSRRPA